MIKSFRLRVTAWYVLFFSVLLFVFSLVLYAGFPGRLPAGWTTPWPRRSATAAALFQSEMQEMGGNAPVAAAESVAEMRTGSIRIAIFAGGAVLAATEPAAAAALRPRLPEAAGMVDAEARLTLPGRPQPSRVLVRRTEAAGRTFLVTASASLESVSAELGVVRRVLLIALPPVPVDRRRRRIPAGRPQRPAAQPDGRAGARDHRQQSAQAAGGRAVGRGTDRARRHFNELLSRLDASFETMRRFIADASHEMRTPLAVIRRGSRRGALPGPLRRRSTGKHWRSSTTIETPDPVGGRPC